MFALMRKFVRSPYAAVLFFLLIVSFGVFGFRDPFNGVIGGGFVQIGGREVRPADVSRGVDLQIDKLRVDQNKIISTREAAQQGITQNVLESLINRTSLLAFADNIGVRASQDAVNTYLLGLPGVRDAVGRADMKTVQQYAQQYKQTPRQFEETVRDDRTYDYVVNAVLQNVSTPEVLSKPLIMFYGEKRTISAARLTPASMAAPKAPTEEDLKAYYEQNKSQFDQPERRRVSVLTLSPSDFADQAVISEDDVKKDYDRRIKEYSTPETREIAQFSGKDLKVIQEFVDLVKQGETLEQAAAKAPGVTRADLNVKTGDLKNKAYNDRVFAMPANTLEGPSQVDEAWLAFQVLKVIPGTPTPFADVSDKIRSRLAQRAGEAKFNETEEQLRDLAGGSPLEEIAKQLGAPVIHLAPVNANAVTGKGEQSTLLAGHPDVVRQLFKMTAGQMTDIVEGDNERSLYRLDEVVPKYTLSFDEAKAQAHDRYLLKKTQEAADKVANDMIAAVKAGKTFEQAAAAGKLATLGAVVMVRSQDTPVDPAIKEVAFGMKEGEVGLARAQTGEPWVVRVDKVEPASTQVDPQLKQQIIGAVSRSLIDDFEEVFVRGVRKMVPINRNDNAITSYFDRILKDDQAQ